MKYLLMLICLFALSCSNEGEEPKAPETQDLTLLKEKYNTYIKLSRAYQDQHGFILTDECDSLLVTGLYGTVKGVSTPDILKARDANGMWHRRPLTHPECYPDHSKSTISRDAFTGLFWFIWVNKRLKIAEELWTYGEKNDWIMGEGDITRTFINPGFKATLAELIFRLGGKNRPERFFPTDKFRNNGYEAHLSALLITLNSDMRKEISSDDLDLMKYHTDRSPRNALFQFTYHKYTDGDYSSVLSTLMDEELFPSDRLPTTYDRLGDWLWARDDDVNWVPSSTTYREHTGGDFLFMASLLIKELEGKK